MYLFILIFLLQVQLTKNSFCEKRNKVTAVLGQSEMILDLKDLYKIYV